MTGDLRMFNSINENKSDWIDSITFDDNGKGKVKGLSKIAISNDLSISNVLLVESLNFSLLLELNFMILVLSAYLVWMM
jgi:hypothetical protein